MSQSTASIRYLKDKEDEVFFPVAHEKGVVDSNGTTLETKLGQKQDTLVSGTNIKTVNNQSIVGSGNITIDSGSDIDTVSVSVDNNTGTPSATGSVSGSTLTLSFTNLKGDTGATGPQGIQGNPGSSQDYPFELENNPAAGGTSKAATAESVKTVYEEVSQLELKLSYLDIAPCDEDGLLFVDEYLNIGVRIDNSGLSAINSITAISL